MSKAPAVKVWSEEDGRLLRLRLDRPKPNLVDAEMIAGLSTALSQGLAADSVKAILLDAEGPNFSFGASVEEHLPAQCADMLKSLHRLLLQLIDSPVPVLVAVSGQCLGGGLELACAGHLIFAAPGARLGQPEIKLGVFAPAASCLLPERVGISRSDDLLLSGRSVDTEEGLRIGLVDFVADDSSGAALDYYREHIAPLSTNSLRFSVRAAHRSRAAHIRAELDEIEQLYLNELMPTPDAIEGLEAFLARREPRWERS